MLNASNAFKRLLYEGKRNYLERVDIVLENRKELSLTNKDLWQGGLSFEDAVSNDNTFEIGSAIINKCTITINNIYDDFSEHDFANAEATVYVGLELPDGKKEWIRKGVFAVDEPKYNGGMITLSCLDNMRKFDKPYSESKLIYPATLGQIVRDACSKCDVILQTDTFPHHDHIVEERPADEATTFREVISWAAQIAGCFCRCDVFGRLELKWYDQEALETAGLDGGIFDKGNPSVYESGDSADGGSFRPWNVGYEADGGTFAELNKVHHITSNYSMDISTDDVVITGIRVLEKTKEEDKEAIVTYQSGSDGYVISIENNGLIQGGAGQQIAEWLGQQLIGFRFRRANASHPSDPTMEAGDVGFLTDRKGNTYRIVVSCTRFSTGGSQTTVSSAQNPARNSAARFSAETKNYVESRKSAKDEISFYDKTVQNMTKLISQGFGMYFTPVPQEDGGNHWFMHNKPTIEESNYVWQMTDTGLMVSLDGGLSWAVDRNGNALYNVITTRGLNADWINSGEIKVGPTGHETFYADYKTGTVRIVADSFSLTSGKTIDSIAQEAAGKKNKVFTSTPTTPYSVGDLWVQGANGDIMRCNVARTSGSYVSSDWGLASDYIDSTKAETVAKTAATTAAEKSWSDKTNVDIFNKLTKNGTVQGITTDDDGNIYINASYINAGAMSANHIRGGTLTLGGVNNAGGVLSILNESGTQIGRWDNTGIEAKAGTIGGFTIGTSKIYATSTDSNKRVIVMQAGKTDSQTAFAAGGHYHDNYSDCPFRVSMAGELYAVSGKIGSFLIDNKERLKTTISGDCDFYIGGGSRWTQAFILYNSGSSPIAYLLNSGAFKCQGVTAPSLENSGDLSLGAGGSKEIKFMVGDAQKGHFDKNGLALANPLHHSGLRYLGVYGSTGTVYAIPDSSKRYKDIQKPMDAEDSASIYRITPVWAKYKPGYLTEDDERNNVNFPMLIAEDVDAHLPYAADHNPDGSVENWNHRVIIPYVIQALKEQKKEIDELKSIIANQ